MTLLREQAVVLRTYRLGEADRIIVLLTRLHGKVRAVAKGVRRTRSKFGSRLEPLSHVALQLWRGRGELAVIDQVEVVDAFRQVREDLDRMGRGLSILEVADLLAQEGHADRPLYEMVVGALRTLCDPSQDPMLLVAAFYLKALALDGAGPVLDRCASCGKPEGNVELVAFDVLEGGALCRSCRRGRRVSPDELILMRRILGGSLAAVLAGPPPPGASQTAALATEAIEVHLDRRLRSVRSVAGI